MIADPLIKGLRPRMFIKYVENMSFAESFDVLGLWELLSPLCTLVAFDTCSVNSIIYHNAHVLCFTLLLMIIVQFLYCIYLEMFSSFGKTVFYEKYVYNFLKGGWLLFYCGNAYIDIHIKSPKVD